MSTDEIWNSFNEQLFAFILKRVKNEDEANDVLQNVFEKIHAKLTTLHSESKLKSWLYQISRNAIVDHFRERKFESGVDIPDESDLDSEGNIYLAAEGCLKRFLNHIPIEQKEAIELVYFENHSQKQLALQLGISYSALKSRVQRGKQKLEELLRECCLKSLCSDEEAPDCAPVCDC